MALSKIDVRNSAETQGLGVFVKDAQTLHPGEIVTEYGASASWVTEEKLHEEYNKKRNPYVFSTGPFRMRNEDEPVYLCWDGSRIGRNACIHNCGHLINSSHPRLVHPWNEDNCMFAIYIDSIRLSARKYSPKAYLYIMCTRTVYGGIDALPAHELRLDYHSVLAAEFGMWCLSLDCASCRKSLLEFCDKYVKPLEDNN